MPSATGYLNMTLFCLSLSLVAQAVGFAIPGWLHILIDRSYNSSYLFEEVVSQNFALWYLVICFEGSCRTKSYGQLKGDVEKTADDKYGYHHNEVIFDYEFTANESKFPFSRLREFQIEAACALVVVLMGVLLVRKQRKSHVMFMSGKRDEEPKQSRHCMSFCYALISGSLILVPASHFVKVNTALNNLAGYYTELNFKVATPYALICSGLGGVLALLSCLFILGAMCQSIFSGDFYSEQALSVVVNDGENTVHQLVPLVPADTQPSTGFTGPVSPGYIPAYGNVPNETVVRILSSDEENNSNVRRGEPGRNEASAGGESRLTDQHKDGDQPFKKPPPSYEEYMQRYSKPP